MFGGQPQQQPPSTSSIFGAPAASSAAPSFFGAPASAAAPVFGFGAAVASQSAGGIFGTAPAAQPATGGIFGASLASQSTGGLFGAAPASVSAGGLFGAAPASQPAGGGLFGAAPAGQSSTGGGLFGAAPSSSTGGLFGAAPAAQPATGGLFGAAPPSQSGTAAVGPAAAEPAAVGEHRKLEEVLEGWEKRLEDQAGQFGRFASEVVAVDRQLVFNQRKLREISESFAKLKTNTVRLDQEVANINAHQEALCRVLQGMLGSGGPSGGGDASQRKLRTVHEQLDDLETQVERMSAALEAAAPGQTTVKPGSSINGLVQLLGIHSKALDTLDAEARSLAAAAAAAAGPAMAPAARPRL